MRTKIIVIAILVIVIGFTAWNTWKTFHKNPSNSNGKISSQSQPQDPSINGSLVSPKLAALRPIAIVIENHVDARPQSGLSEAEIVYETLAEGGITRFLAIFQTADTKNIGPVRSARPYFNFLANMWHAPLVHSGGSKQALSELSSNFYENLFDANEFYYGTYFSRDSSKFAPHNLYTTIQNIRDLLAKKNETNWNKLSLWDTQTSPPEQVANEVTNITIPFSNKSYEVTYQFDSATNSYKRSIGNVATIDENNNQQISPKNVLVMLTDISLNLDDDKGTQNIKLNGSGPCFLFKTGRFIKCNWELKNGLHYYTDTDGNAIKFEAGQTWIEIFPRDRQNDIIWK